MKICKLNFHTRQEKIYNLITWCYPWTRVNFLSIPLIPLSARYIETKAALSDRSAVDSLNSENFSPDTCDYLDYFAFHAPLFKCRAHTYRLYELSRHIHARSFACLGIGIKQFRVVSFSCIIHMYVYTHADRARELARLATHTQKDISRQRDIYTRYIHRRETRARRNYPRAALPLLLFFPRT